MGDSDISVAETLFWLNFTRVAYDMYAPGVTNPPQPANFPAGWRQVRNITADAGIRWFKKTEFLGFVAQSEVNPNQYAVLLHGTEGIRDFLDDFEFLKTDFSLVQSGGRTEYGFTRFYESVQFVDPATGTKETLTQYLAGLNNDTSFTVVGFSLGAAVATLHAAVLASRNIPVKAYLFASPMVGDSTFVATYNELVPNTHRIVNKPDIVPDLPGTILGYAHVNGLYEINSLVFPQLKHSITCFHSPEVYAFVLGEKNVALGGCIVTT